MHLKPPDIWNETYKHDPVRGLPEVSLLSVISETAHQRRLVARMEIETHDPDATVRWMAYVSMTPTQMRALAATLQATATRVEQVLIPKLHPEPTIIPIALYREPEPA